MIDPIITEEYREFAAGRGKKLVIAIKGSIPQQKKASKKNLNRFCLNYLKSNPNSIQFVIYKKNLNVVIYPEKRRLSKEEFDRLLSAFIALRRNWKNIRKMTKCHQNDGILHLSTKGKSNVCLKKVKRQFSLDAELFSGVKEQSKRLENWLNRKPKK